MANRSACLSLKSKHNLHVTYLWLLDDDVPGLCFLTSSQAMSHRSMEVPRWYASKWKDVMVASWKEWYLIAKVLFVIVFHRGKADEFLFSKFSNLTLHCRATCVCIVEQCIMICHLTFLFTMHCRTTCMFCRWLEVAMTVLLLFLTL